MKFTNRILAEVLWWFGFVCAIFGVVTELSGQQIYLSSYFYLETAIVAFLAGILVVIKERK
ncbi:MAG: hypothetical protein ABIH38_04785 [Patescibacteria group bacterium]